MIGEWIVIIFYERNYIENFYREIKGCLGLKEYFVRDKISMMCYFILVFVVYIFFFY